ncbi:MAG TPA: protein translocase subunit SecD [Anaerolineae bacterium]|nr:protein translocase subunit SecD [Anaerolineae bacterium]
MEQRNITAFIGIVLLTAALSWIVSVNLNYVYPTGPEAQTQEPPWWANLLIWQGEQERSIQIHQGLDLKGGLQVVLEADLPAEQLQEGSMEAARTIVENRVNGLGVTEPLVQLQGDNRMIVELPGITDPELAIRTLRETGLLEFVDAGSMPIPEGTVIRTSFGDDRDLPTEEGAAVPEGPVYDTVITGGDLASVSNAGINPNTREIEINFSLTNTGGQKFGNYTGANVGSFLCIVIDKAVLSCPVVNARIDSNGTISLGSDSLEEGQALAIQLRYGSLPVPLKVVENRSVGPTLGQDSVQRSLRAGTVGIIVVLLFTIIYYRVPGFVAALALVLYGLLNLALYKLIPVTMTLPAITGFILSIGMAVDANILIFERMKEELRAGRRLKMAMELGFARSWPSIRDSAISTLITCAILFWFGSNFGASVVKGFAITLALGVVTNLFTAITVSRNLLRILFNLTGEEIKSNPVLMGFSLQAGSETAPGWVSGLLNIVGKRRIYYTFSAITIALGLVAMGASTVQFGTPLKPSIDFTSGSLMELQFENPVQPAQVRSIFTGFSHNGQDFQDTIVTTAEQLGQETILVRSKFLDDEAKSAVQARIQDQLGAFTELRFDSVGPTIGAEVTRAGIYAVIAASIAILIFFVLAFRSVPNPLRFGVAAVAAMLHDILVTSGIFAIFGVLFGWEVDALFLTAILTVIGYSVHDTIIVFDRVRENLPRYRTEPFEAVANRSLLETLTRSVMTSLSTTFVVIALLIFGGATITQFVTIILIGIISGTYSSIFNAVPILVSWHYGEIGSLFKRTSKPAEAHA